ncbi:hypothetical protein THJ86_001033 [Campylobacter coli]|nr:hypothetical protein [Campylobacter coli]ELZ2420735.1 hypothetical protein [Campylobacter coli]
MNNKALQEEILALQKEVLELENQAKTIEETIDAIKQRVQNLKDIAWDRQSKKESSQMYKVLNDNKEYTQVKSSVGNIKVDKDFMEKQTKKHLDNPNLRGMVTTEEMLSYPKVAKNVEAEYDERYQGYSWKVKANDGNIINYGERDYGEGHRLLTAHSKTGKDERGQLRREFNDRNFHDPVKEIIPKSEAKNQPKTPIDFQAKLKEFTQKQAQDKNPSKDKEINR